MELIRGLSGLRACHRPSVATIGAFDGVHLGHQAVVTQLLEQAAEHDLPTTVVTFEPHPREFLQPLQAPARLTTLREKIEVLAEAGVARLLYLRFDESLRQMDAQAFIDAVLLRGLGVRSLILGDDFRFGRGRAGDSDMVRATGAREGFATLPTATLEIDGARVSSTRIRAALATGDFAQAQRLLGRPYRMAGRVIHGRRLGRELGSPTANIALGRRVSPLAGVYAVSVTGAGLRDAPAVANVGTRPTVEAAARANLEVHILDLARSLYGERLHVQFHHKLRDEQRFESLDDLRAQIALDRDNARQWFATHTWTCE
jgi:riboflavin kinase/FMN adenylyltransferase